ncbi:MAG: competence protein ComE, partial [Microcoleus sp. SIO2G3]|nr:competence protein ComE [Microcoleus sp. SIO2G3]
MRLPSTWLRFALLLLLGLLLAAGFTRWQKPVANSLTLAPPLPQDEYIQVYFNHSPAAAYTEPYRPQTRLGDDLEQVIVDAIAT